MNSMCNARFSRSIADQRITPTEVVAQIHHAFDSNGVQTRYCQELCTGRLADISSGGGFGLLDSVHERDSLNHVG